MLKLVIFQVLYLCLEYSVSASFGQDCLVAHNNFRARHGAPPLELSDSLTSFAQQWADNLVNAGIFERRPQNKYGENIYLMSGWSAPANEVVKTWYNEIEHYNFNRLSASGNADSFTQLVWRDSTKLGCAIAKRGDVSYVVANYDPPGNVQGEYDSNVLKQFNFNFV